MKKLRVGVVYGGRSGEHEVSIASAASIFRHLDRSRYEPVPIRIDKDGLFSLDLAKTKKAVTGLTHAIMTLQAHGDYAGGEQLFERMVVIRPEVKHVIDRLGNVPVDIAPKFVTAAELTREH